MSGIGFLVDDGVKTEFAFKVLVPEGATQEGVVDFSSVNAGISSAENISFDNTGSGLTATSVQEAIVEVNSTVDVKLADKVDKELGKGLSEVNFSVTDKAKLDGIAEGAEVNTVVSVAGKVGAVTLTKGDVGLTLVDNTSDLDKPISTAQAFVNSTKVNFSDIVDTLTSTSADKPLSANQGRVLKTLIDNINTLLVSNDVTLDELQEIVDFIKQNKETLDTLSISNIAGLQDSLDTLSQAIEGKVSNIDIIGGTVGSALSIPIITYNTQGQITAASSSPVSFGNGTISVVSGDGLSGSGEFSLNQAENATITISHSDTSSVVNTTNTDRTYIQNIQVDSFGHITGVTSAVENYSYTLPAATSTTLGGIKLAKDTVNTASSAPVTNVDFRTYGIQFNPAGEAVVNVPWVDTNTTYTAGSGLSLVGTTFSNTAPNVTTDLSTSYSSDSVTISSSDGTDSVINAATASLAGVLSSVDKVKLDGIATGANNYVLPVATASTLGGVKSGTDITIDASGNVSVNNDSHTHSFANLTSKPTTLSGYGITDAQPLDADLTSIAGLAGTTGLLRKTAANTWSLDTNSYVTSSGVTSVTGTAPIVSSGGTTPAISISAATTSAAGSMSAADKSKLDGIATNANNYSLPTATSTVLGGVELFSDSVQSVAANAVSATASRTYGLQLNSAGQAVVNVPWVDTNTTYTAGTGLSLTGTVFANTAPNVTTNLSTTTSDTTLTVVSSDGTNAVLPAATQTVAGVMTGADKSKLDGIATGATANTGTVTSVGVTAGNGLTGGGTVTTSGTVTLNVASHAGTAGSIGTINVSADAIGVNLGTTSTTAARGDHTHTAASVGAPATTTTTSIGLENTQSCVAYTTGISLFGQTDGALYSNIYSASWKHQIYGDYRSGNIAVRGKNNGTWTSWSTVWTSGNDGEGSGLDADLLDGQQGSYYQNASNLTAGTIADARISGSYTGMTNLTGSGTVDFSRFLGNATDTVAAPSFSWTGDDNTGIYSPAADQLAVTTGGVQRALFSSTGITGDLTANVITIGNGVKLSEATDRADLLRVESQTTTWAGIQIDNTATETLWSLMADGTTFGIYDDTSNAWMIDCVDGGATRLFHAGSAKISTTTTGISVTGTITESSDKRLKENVETLTNSLDKVKHLRGVSYNKIGSTLEEIGFIAQEVEEVVPEIVETDDEGMKAVSYARTVALLVEAMKEQQELLEETQKECRRLAEELIKLKGE